MKRIFASLFLLSASGLLLAQNAVPAQSGAVYTTVFQSENSTRSWNDFDRRSGLMTFEGGSDFLGSSMAFNLKGDGRFIYGIRLNVLAVPSANRILQDQFNTPYSETSLLLPVWFTLKFRLLNSPYSKISPYVSTGAGPTFGFRFNSRNRLSDTFSGVDSYLGAGGYVGGGFDYLWAEKWALSLEARYHVYRLDSPRGLNDGYEGFSFAVGFVKAFGN